MMNGEHSQVNGLGTSLGLLAWGLLFLIIAKIFHLTTWVLWIAQGSGFLFLLVGIMGVCIEFGRVLGTGKDGCNDE